MSGNKANTGETVKLDRTPAYKIVIAAGQEYSIPATLDDEQIRASLAAILPEVASAAIVRGTREVTDPETDQVITVETLEFVKKAGIKGLEARELAGLLTRAPAMEDLRQQSPKETLLRRLLQGGLSVAQATEHYETLNEGLDDLEGAAGPYHANGARLCQKLDKLPAAPADLQGW